MLLNKQNTELKETIKKLKDIKDTETHADMDNKNFNSNGENEL
ncbi:hypothetical protein [Clostridium caldaquaticum]|nr:hypothetical protein [Clostridium caldaquaticum]